MRSYREYYNLAKDEHLTWLAMLEQQNEWWKKDEYNRFKELEVMGDYLKGTKFLSRDEKNDASLFINRTNVKNSEWSILFSMLGQALVDWCVENERTKFWSFSLTIQRALDGLTEYYVPKFKVETYDNEDSEVTDKKELKKWEDCRNALCDIIWDFIYTHKNDIPNDWNYISFSLDDLEPSCQAGQWVCFSDGYFGLACIKSNDNGCDTFVECM